MTNNHLTKNSDEASPIASIASIACRIGGLIGAVVLSGLLLASCGSGVTELGATVTALSGAGVKTAQGNQTAGEHLFQTYTNWLQTSHAHAVLHAQDKPLPNQF